MPDQVYASAELPPEVIIPCPNPGWRTAKS